METKILIEKNVYPTLDLNGLPPKLEHLGSRLSKNFLVSSVLNYDEIRLGLDAPAYKLHAAFDLHEVPVNMREYFTDLLKIFVDKNPMITIGELRKQVLRDKFPKEIKSRIAMESLKAFAKPLS